MTPSPGILIAGAGWRVHRFIIPALLAAGVRPAQITLLRRSADARRVPIFDGVQITTRFADIASHDFGMTLNCVSAPSLVEVQKLLVRQFPSAAHFCDTPIFSDPSQLSDVIRLSWAKLFSLEDWPLMPNLSFLRHQARKTNGTLRITVANFGIITHFLSFYRSLGRPWHLGGRTLSKEGSSLLATRGRTHVEFQFVKNLPLAKTSLSTDDSLVEDYHEVEERAHSNNEIFYRIIGDSFIRYYCGPVLISEHQIDQSIINLFAPFQDRKNVHELDKVVALTELFRNALRGDTSMAYRYTQSARDTLASRALSTRDRCFLL